MMKNLFKTLRWQRTKDEGKERRKPKTTNKQKQRYERNIKICENKHQKNEGKKVEGSKLIVSVEQKKTITEERDALFRDECRRRKTPLAKLGGSVWVGWKERGRQTAT